MFCVSRVQIPHAGQANMHAVPLLDRNSVRRRKILRLYEKVCNQIYFQTDSIICPLMVK